MAFSIAGFSDSQSVWAIQETTGRKRNPHKITIRKRVVHPSKKAVSEITND
jgi:hypothetical protein